MNQDRMKPKIKKLYYSIGEVAELTGLKAYVLRYWETEFKQLSPPKNRAGNRTYRQKDIDTILEIKDLLYKKKFTIDGARHVLTGGAELSTQEKHEDFSEKHKTIFSKIRNELQEVLNIIQN